MSAAERIQLSPTDEMGVQDAAEYLGTRIGGRPWSKQHLYNLLSTSRGPRCEKRRGRLMFRKRDLDDWVRDNTEVRSAYSK